MSTQEELTEALEDAYRANTYFDGMAEDLLAEGWRPPMRVIETVEELETLPEESAVVDHMGEIHVKDSLLGVFCETWGEEKRSAERMFREIGGPFRVVWEPEQ